MRLSTNLNVRDSNLELFRCLLMLLIVAHHYFVHSHISNEIGNGETIYLNIIGMWGKTGINCFILITGYFMCNKQITLRKFLILFLQVAFYKIVIFFLFYLRGYYDAVPTKDLVYILLPFNLIGRVFPESYLLFFLFIPFLSILVNNVNRRQHIILILLLLLPYSIMAHFPFVHVSMNYVIWFSILFIISSYIRFYKIDLCIKASYWGYASILFICLSIASVIVLLSQNSYNPLFFVEDSNKVFAIVVSILLFLYFKNIRISYSPFINLIGASTFGIFLIHDNSGIMRDWLWNDLVNHMGFHANIYFASIIYITFVFSICSIIDLARLYFLEKPLFRVLDKYFEKNIFYSGKEKITKR